MPEKSEAEDAGTAYLASRGHVRRGEQAAVSRIGV